ncbi:MAG: hypothetical protein V5783_03605 [Pontiella sp.]
MGGPDVVCASADHEHGLTEGVNDGYEDNAEAVPDGMNNLMEYALGGDRLLNDAANVLPEFTMGRVMRWQWQYGIRIPMRGVQMAMNGLSEAISSIYKSYFFVVF